MKIVWRKAALQDLENIMDYIANRDNITSAKKLIKQIIDKANGLTVFPEKNQKETLVETDRNIRRAVIHSYKIFYEIIDNKIFILHILSTYQNPDKLQNLLT